MRARLTILGASLLIALATAGARAQAPYPDRALIKMVGLGG
jgi:hypothetical protein